MRIVVGYMLYALPRSSAISPCKQTNKCLIPISVCVGEFCEEDEAIMDLALTDNTFLFLKECVVAFPDFHKEASVLTIYEHIVLLCVNQDFRRFMMAVRYQKADSKPLLFSKYRRAVLVLSSFSFLVKI